MQGQFKYKEIFGNLVIHGQKADSRIYLDSISNKIVTRNVSFLIKME